MRNALFTLGAAFVAMVLTGCARRPLVQPPIPAPLSAYEAAAVADHYLAGRNLEWGGPDRIDPHEWGYTLAYSTPFDPAAKPPKQAHLLFVSHDGTVSQWPAP